MKTVYNFSAGPSMLPPSVLKKAQKELMNYNNCGISVMEMSHRSDEFFQIISSAEALLREIMEIPTDYKVLFLQGGASTQFAAVPLNLMNKNKKADYIISGQFSLKAYKQAVKYGDVAVAASSKKDGFCRVPVTTKESFRPDADYVHMCYNNTIYGTKFYSLPDTGDIPIVADMSSCILSEPIDVKKFGLIYAGAQKNMAPAGLTVVIVRKDLIGNERDDIPATLSYRLMTENNSMYNTPPCYCIYLAGLVYQWIKDLGGLSKMKVLNENKAKMLYSYLDSQNFYIPLAEKDSRSIMNITFTTGNDELNKKFIKQAAENALINLKGHRSIGGMRASIYNAMPYEGVLALKDFMTDFALKNSK